MASNDSQAFLLLHNSVQHWIYHEGWKELRDIQEQAIKPILSGSTDLIIASPTASGKQKQHFSLYVQRFWMNQIRVSKYFT